MAEGPAGTILRSVPEGHGYLAWRRLWRRYQPAAAGRWLGVLQRLMAFVFSGDLRDRLDAFEQELGYCERQSKESVSDNIRVGIVLSRVT
eukprot:9495012-Alexandrium_andersonii.AAC.1